MLITAPANVRYLTGYAGSNGLVLITPHEAHFFTDPRYAIEAEETIDCRVHIAKRSLLEAAAAIIKRKKIKRVGFEESNFTVAFFRHLEDSFPLGSSLHAAGGMVEELRMIKSQDEIEKIRHSVNVNSEAYRRTLRRVKIGATERDIAAELEFQMRRLGAEKPAFETIVAAGARSALPHSTPTGRRVEDNEILLVDMGATVDGYTSDMTRVSHAGVPSKRIKGYYDAVLEAQLAGVDAIRPGIAASRVDARARKVLKEHGLDRFFVHSTGHGLGLEIHEGPRVARRASTKLAPGMVITVEPGVYVEDVGGIRIEDTVLVTDAGCEVLTPTSKELVEI